MTFREATLALQLLAEERVGATARARIYEQKAREDAAVAAAAGVND